MTASEHLSSWLAAPPRARIWPAEALPLAGEPLKSISGIIGLGAEVEYRPYTCDFCAMETCPSG